jgi:hypothetical protein
MTKRKAVKDARLVVINDPDNETGALKCIGGSLSDHWNNLVGNQTIQALSLSTLWRPFVGTASIGPRDELEGMMAQSPHTTL